VIQSAVVVAFDHELSTTHFVNMKLIVMMRMTVRMIVGCNRIIAKHFSLFLSQHCSRRTATNQTIL